MGNYHFIKSKLSGNFIDVQEVSTKPEALLDAYPHKASNDNQLWQLVFDPACAGRYFIQSKLHGYVIDIVEASIKPGAQRDAYPKKSPAPTISSGK